MTTTNPYSEQQKNEILTAWVHGWTISRGTEAAFALAGYGYKIHVGLPGHLERYVLQGQALSAIQLLAHELSIPDTWIKICAPVSEIGALLPPRWTLKPVEYLMCKPITAHVDIDVPGAYTIQFGGDEQAVSIKALGPDGQIAATGRMALTARYAVFDQIVTEPSHRRKGLGRLLMQMLSNHAFARQADTGVLVATEDGYALYSALGWSLCSPMTAAVINS
ncbi:GNAT family N-acetyltransferase [Undibacterium sp. CY18W]|uniref:GNAT family N-acetyltransferase n=1 Tax=Undibacterium hunanense TaxID=2762292 RepID=A0ABR6ZQA3_9BURK|nr:GNAT family N-acetyltransferase [Undibacterium hunanense]MBC3917708.1 GNAT family N-acetyltransferase [Undibacterium hunanense]